VASARRRRHGGLLTTGQPRDITDRAFVVRKVYRVNDRLPSESTQSPKWKWHRAGWLLVDRPNGPSQRTSLARFRPVLLDGELVSRLRGILRVLRRRREGVRRGGKIGVKKPLVHKEPGRAHGGDMPDSECDAPTWQRPPVRVTIVSKDGQPVTFAIHRQASEATPEHEAEE
jgi:hypothetical protein